MQASNLRPKRDSCILFQGELLKNSSESSQSKMKITCVGMILLVFLTSTLAMPSKYADQDKKRLENAYRHYFRGKWLFCVTSCMCTCTITIQNCCVIGDDMGLCYPVSTMCFGSYFDSPTWNTCCGRDGGNSWQEHLFAPCYRW